MSAPLGLFVTVVDRYAPSVGAPGQNIASLVIFCRRPDLGVGKQRIAKVLGQTYARDLGEVLLRTALEDGAAWPGPVILAPAEVEDADWAQQLGHEDWLVIPQAEGNLGERLNHVDDQLRRLGHEKIIYIGSDAPTLDSAYYAAADAALVSSDVILGRATDGGVTLMGARKPWPELKNLPWSSENLGDALKAACVATDYSVAELPKRYDIDLPADLDRLPADLGQDQRPARQALLSWLNNSAAEQTKLSLIIPVLGDTQELTKLFAVLRTGSETPDEIIVVDGAKDAQCQSLCDDNGAQYLATSRGRGRQLRAGAAAATGDWLWFLHADTQPSKLACKAIRASLSQGAAGGCLRFRFAGRPSQARSLLAKLINWRTRIGIPYGDQGLFATRRAYETAGGFANQALFEEVQLVRGLRRTGRFEHVPAPIEVSPRRWEQEGWLRRSCANRLLAIGYMLGVSPGTLAKHHRPILKNQGQ